MYAAVQAVQVPWLSVADVLVEQQRLVLTVSMPELTQLESGKSMMRYLPPNGTAGFASFLVRAYNLEP